MAQLGQSNTKGKKASCWSEHLPELFAGGVLLAFAVLVISCSKFGEKNATVAINQPSATASTPAMAPASPSIPAPAAKPAVAEKKSKKKRPTTATYVNPDYGVSLTYPRKYSLLVGDEARLKWDGLGPVETNFVNSGGRTLAAVKLPSDLFPDTDLASAFINVGVKTGLTNTECTKFAFPQEGAAGKEPQPRTIIGANEFVEATEFNEQATAQAEGKYYHVFQNGACYEFGLGVGTMGDNSDPKIAQVDRQRVFDRLEKILATVKIQPAEVPASEGQVETQAPAEKTAPAEPAVSSAATPL
jgi:hypothetical protein